MGQKKVLVLGGCGKQGTIVAKELAKNHKVTVADHATVPIPGIFTIKIDMLADSTWESLIADSDCVVSCLPGNLAQKPIQKILKYQKSYCDLSFTSFNYKTIDSYAKSAKCTILHDLGWAPGLPNLILGHLVKKYQTLEKVQIYVGGNSLERTVNKMGYVPTWSLEDLYEEYTRPARIISKGKVKTYHPLYTPEQMYNDEMNAFYSDGLRSLLSLKNVIPDMEESTIRWAGHMNHVKRLIDGYHEREIPVEKHKFLFTQDMERLCSPRGKDWAIMDMKIQTEFVKHRPIEYKMHVLGTNEMSAMSKLTAYSCAAFCEVLLQGLYKEHGVHPPEDLGMHRNVYDFVFQYLSIRGVELLND